MLISKDFKTRFINYTNSMDLWMWRTVYITSFAIVAYFFIWSSLIRACISIRLLNRVFMFFANIQCSSLKYDINNNNNAQICTHHRFSRALLYIFFRLEYLVITLHCCFNQHSPNFIPIIQFQFLIVWHFSIPWLIVEEGC